MDEENENEVVRKRKIKEIKELEMEINNMDRKIQPKRDEYYRLKREFELMRGEVCYHCGGEGYLKREFFDKMCVARREINENASNFMMKLEPLPRSLENIINEIIDFNILKWLSLINYGTIGQEEVREHGFTTNQQAWIIEISNLINNKNEKYKRQQK